MPCISAMLALADALYIIFVFLYWTRNKGDKYRFGVAKKNGDTTVNRNGCENYEWSFWDNDIVSGKKLKHFCF